MQNFIVMGWIFYEQQHFEISLNFEFDRNIISGTGTWWPKERLGDILLPVDSGQWLAIDYNSHEPTGNISIDSTLFHGRLFNR